MNDKIWICLMVMVFAITGCAIVTESAHRMDYYKSRGSYSKYDYSVPLQYRDNPVQYRYHDYRQYHGSAVVIPIPRVTLPIPYISHY